ncbi:MAG: DUF2058 family protein [Planctomycetota bacterium]
MAKDGKKKGKPLTGLAAALVKAGVMPEKQARGVAREQRKEAKELGEEGLAERRAAEQQALAQRAADAAEAERAALRAGEAEAAAQLIRDHAWSGYQGRRRWFFVERSGQVSFLDVNDEVTALLRDGQAAVVAGLDEDEGQTFVVKGADVLGKIALVARENILFWNGARDRA